MQNIRPATPQYFLYVALIGAALFSVESWIFGPLSWIYGYGSGLETIPVLKALSVHHRNFSLWSPFVAGGVDRLAFWGNANPIGPEILLFSFLPTWLANGLHRFLQYFIAIYFGARVSYEQIHLEIKWSCLSGILFGCFSYFTVGALFTLPGVPLMLWLLPRAVGENGNATKTIAVAFLFSMLTTFTFGVPYLLVFAFIWLIFIQKINCRRTWFHFLLFCVFLVLFTLMPLLAIALNAPSSHRANWSIEPITWTLNQLFYRQLQFDLFAQDKALMAITMNLPWITILIGALLTLLSWQNKKCRQFSEFFIRITLVFIFLSQRWLWLTIQHCLIHFAPFIRGVYMGRFFEIPAGFLIALELTLTLRLLWFKIHTIKITRMIVVVSVSILILFMIIKPKQHLFYSLGVDDWGQANYQVPAIETLRKENPSPFRVASVLPLQPAYAYAQGLETVDGWANIYPETYRNLWLQILEPLFKEIPETQQIFGLKTGRAEDNFIFLGADLVRSGVGLLPDEDVNAALKNGFDIDRRFNLNLLRLLNTKYLLSEYPLKSNQIRLVHAPDKWPTWPQYRSRNTGLVEGERIPSISKPGLLQPLMDAYHAGKRKLHHKDIFIYEILNSIERFRFVTTVIIEPDQRAILHKLANSNKSILQESAILEKSEANAFQIKSRLSPGIVKLISYQADTIHLNVTNKGQGLLVIANNWSPYWQASIDGKKTALLKMNYLQSGLKIPSGTHQVVLRYLPPYKLYFDVI